MANKYGTSPKSERTYDGKVYDSKLEMNYRKHLELLKRATDKNLRVSLIFEQIQYAIKINGHKICKYILDFEVHYANGTIEHIDCKGMKTPIYRLKKKLVEATYPIKIKEITKGQF